MSFMGGGAECSTGRNPLAQFTKHVGEDKSLQRDRMVGGLPVGAEAGNMRSIGGDMAGVDQQMMEEFYNQQAANSPFAFDGMRRELSEIQHAPGGGAQQQWAAEFGPQPTMSPQEQAAMEAAFRQKSPEFNAADFQRFQAQQQGPNNDVRMGSPGPQQAMGYRPQQFQGYQHFNSGMPFQSHYPYQQQQQLQQQGPALQDAKGKGKQVVELSDENWEQQFKEMETLQNPIDIDLQANKDIDAELTSQSEALFGDFQAVWEGLQGEAPPTTDWANEIDSSMPWSAEDSLTTSMPRLGDYLFEPDNPYMQHSDPFSEGKRLMDNGGNLSLAALAFEAAVQKERTHVAAWTELGACQAANEKETPAIRALEAALKLDEANLKALMGLAVSYTNEGYDTTAYNTLERWLSAKYPQVAQAAGPGPSHTLDRKAIHDRVTSMFIQAAQLSPEGTAMDSDVQVGLGVLLYGDEEYDKAVDCFTAALHSTSTSTSPEHLLWNRLGATLANSGRSEEAINAYEHALNINPNFVRARYNLGVSCINIGCYEQAAEHLLGALAMHKVAEEKAREDAGKIGVEVERITQNQSTNLYDTLRRVFAQMGRRDLADLVSNGMDIEVFRKEFEF